MSSARIGGLVGLADGGDISDSNLSGVTITGKGDQDSGENHWIGYVGGLIGEVTNSNSETMLVDNCHLEDINLAVGTSEAYAAEQADVSKSGGLIEAVADPASDWSINGDVEIKNSSAAGRIEKGKASVYDTLTALGGAFGVVYGGETPAGKITISNSQADVDIGPTMGDKLYLDVLVKYSQDCGGVGGFAGRMEAGVVGNTSVPENISHVYANQNMQITADDEEVTDPGLHSHWGADITAEQFDSGEFFTTPDNWSETWDFDSIWEIKLGADRPTLQGVGNDDGNL